MVACATPRWMPLMMPIRRRPIRFGSKGIGSLNELFGMSRTFRTAEFCRLRRRFPARCTPGIFGATVAPEFARYASWTSHRGSLLRATLSNASRPRPFSWAVNSPFRAVGSSQHGQSPRRFRGRLSPEARCAYGPTCEPIQDVVACRRRASPCCLEQSLGSI